MSSLKLKTGVEPRNLYIMAAIANVVATLKDPADVVVTAGCDGQHKTGSRHYTYQALDVRSKTFTPEGKVAFLKAVLARLGPEYQGFLEAQGLENEHFHFEWDHKI